MKNILIIEPATSGLKLILTGYRLGYNILIFSAQQDERIIPEFYKPYIFKEFKVNTLDLKALEELTLSVNKTLPISAIIPGFEIFVHHVAYLSQLIGVPGITLDASYRFRNKEIMRQTLSKAGLASPGYTKINSIDELRTNLPNINFPCILKPIDQSGSVHVSRSNSPEELIHSYHRMCNDPWTEMGKGIGSSALVEDYVDGEEFSVEGFVQNKKVTFLSITKKFLEREPFFVEVAHVVEADISSELRQKIYTYVGKVLQVFEYDLGVFHCELRVKEGEPILIEIAGRLAGDKIPDLIFLALNIDLYEIMLKIYLGEMVTDAYQAQYKQHAGIKFLTSSLTSYQSIHGLSVLKRFKGYQDFQTIIKPGQSIPPLENFLGRIAYCIATAPSYSQLLSLFNEIETIITFN